MTEDKKRRPKLGNNLEPEEENLYFVDIVEALVLSEDETQAVLPKQVLGPLKTFFLEEINGPDSELAIEGFLRAVGAFDELGHEIARDQLLTLWAEMLSHVNQASDSAGEKLKSKLTGSTDLSQFKPAAPQPAPKGSIKAGDLMRHLQSQKFRR